MIEMSKIFIKCSGLIEGLVKYKVFWGGMKLGGVCENFFILVDWDDEVDEESVEEIFLCSVSGYVKIMVG